MRIGILTGGGDCPGLNAVIRAVVLAGHARHGDNVVGFRDGWRGVLNGASEALDPQRCHDILTRGGTILGTSRTNPFATEDGPRRVMEVLAAQKIEALIVIGGEDTLGVAHRLGDRGVQAVGVPKTIDNDLAGTDVTFGFHTAVQTATEAIDRLQTTAESHHRVIVCEVMGRHAGWIATYAGIAGGAAEILVPEIPFELDGICSRLRRRHERGVYSSLVVVAEGAVPVEGAPVVQDAKVDEFGHARLGGIGAWLAEQIEGRTGYEARVTILGHIQRGGTPTAYDRLLATRFGVAALDAVHEGAFGSMVALRGPDVVRIPLSEAVASPKTVDLDLLHHVASPFLG